MLTSAAHHGQIAPSASTASAVSSLIVDDFDRDSPRVAIPRPEMHLVVRFGPAARSGIDVHAFGVRQTAHRKLIHRGQRSVQARLRLGAHLAVLGAPASAIAGHIVSIEDLWGQAAAGRLCDRLAQARDSVQAAAVLESAIAERLARVARADVRAEPTQHTRLALDSAAMLTRSAGANVNTVAGKLGVSERHLRRVFRETLGVSPKTFARLARFQRALGAARASGQVSWASIAADSGYYDQAHLIAEFRMLSGATPQVLLDELRSQTEL